VSYRALKRRFDLSNDDLTDLQDELIAARLQGLAAADTVVISATTQQLVQGLFTCQTLGTPALKGLD
jgi:hypothetical protein